MRQGRIRRLCDPAGRALPPCDAGRLGGPSPGGGRVTPGAARGTAPVRSREGHGAAGVDSREARRRAPDAAAPCPLERRAERRLEAQVAEAGLMERLGFDALLGMRAPPDLVDRDAPDPERRGARLADVEPPVDLSTKPSVLLRIGGGELGVVHADRASRPLRHDVVEERPVHDLAAVDGAGDPHPAQRHPGVREARRRRSPRAASFAHRRPWSAGRCAFTPAWESIIWDPRGSATFGVSWHSCPDDDVAPSHTNRLEDPQRPTWT